MTGALVRSRQFVAAARLLLDEGHADSAANRAYYAMFHAMQAALAAVGVESRQVKSHAGVKRLFDQHLVWTGRIGRDMSLSVQRGMEMRWQADYGEPVANLPAHRLIHEAERFIAACEALIGDSP